LEIGREGSHYTEAIKFFFGGAVMKKNNIEFSPSSAILGKT